MNYFYNIFFLWVEKKKRVIKKKKLKIFMWGRGFKRKKLLFLKMNFEIDW